MPCGHAFALFQPRCRYLRKRISPEVEARLFGASRLQVHEHDAGLGVFVTRPVEVAHDRTGHFGQVGTVTVLGAGSGMLGTKAMTWLVWLFCLSSSSAARVANSMMASRSSWCSVAGRPMDFVHAVR